jgi:hypothetical protein
MLTKITLARLVHIDISEITKEIVGGTLTEIGEVTGTG